MQAAGIEVLVEQVRFDPCVGDFMQAGAGMTYALVDVQLTNVGFDGVGDYSGFSWLLVDSFGEDYPVLLTPTCHQAPEGEPSLAPGVTVRSLLAFEIPGDAPGLELVYDGVPLHGEGTRIVAELET